MMECSTQLAVIGPHGSSALDRADIEAIAAAMASATSSSLVGRHFLFGGL